MKGLDWWLDVLAHWEIFSPIRLWECLPPAYEPSYLSVVPTPLPGPAHPQYSCPKTSFVGDRKESFWLGRTLLEHPSLARKPWGWRQRCPESRQHRQEHWAGWSRTASGTQVPWAAAAPVRQCQGTGSNTVLPLFINGSVLSDMHLGSWQIALPKPILQHHSGGCKQNRCGHPYLKSILAV